jgi:signal transduction histidine kinase
VGREAQHTTVAVASSRGVQIDFVRQQASNNEPAGHLLACAREVDLAAVILRDGRVTWSNALTAELFGVSDPRELQGVRIDSLMDAPGANPGSDGKSRTWLRRSTGDREIEIVRIGDPRAERATRSGVGSPCDAGGPARRGALPNDGDEELWVICDVESSDSFASELRTMGAALAEARRELEAVRGQLSLEILEREQLLSVVSHELRTPITVIRGYNNLLLSDDVGELNTQQQGFLHESNRSCERLNRFVGDLLAACGEAGSRLSVERKPASLAPLVAGLATFLRPLLEQHDLTLATDLADDAVEAEFDAVRIEQVITNLLINAIRYSKADSTIRVKSRRLNDDAIEVSVVDTGPGVAHENRERIFEPYVRAGDDRSAGGLGLGLAICKRIVDAHGGEIFVEDAHDSGSRFVFSLPLEAEVG